MKKILAILTFIVSVQTYAQHTNRDPDISRHLKEKALEIIPNAYQNHPEFGKLSLDLASENIELIHLRTASARTFLDEKGQYHTQQTAGIFNFKDANGRWISMQEKISAKEGKAGIFQTELPLYVDLATGKTTLSLDKQGNTLNYGENNTLQVLDQDLNPISEFRSEYTGSHAIEGNQITLNDYFHNIDRIHDLNYWDLQTDFLIKSKMDFGANAQFIQFEDQMQLPESWTLAYAEGEMKESGWQGTLVILNEKGELMSEISRPLLYDSFKSDKKEDYNGHGTMGFYLIEKTPAGYVLKLRVPLSWLNSEKLIYPVRIDPTATNTYAGGQGLQDKNTTFSSGCQSSMNVSFPSTYFQVTGTAIAYTIRAKGYIASSGGTDYYGDRVEQRSRIGAGSNWTATQSGVGTDHSGPANNQAYSLSAQTIANGCYSGVSTITYVWQGYQNFFPTGSPASTNVTGCVINYQELLANTWVVTTTYTVMTMSVDAGPNATICVGTTTTLNATVSGHTSMSWSPSTTLTSSTISNPVASPLTTVVYTLTVVNGACTLTDNVTITVNSPSSTGMSTGDWVFTGAVSTEYENPANWLKWTGAGYTAILTYTGQTGIRPPQITDNVRIKPNGTCVLTQPITTNVNDGGFTAPNSVSANCKNIVIESGASLSFGATAANPSHFHVAEVWTNNGTLNPANGRVKFIGTGAQSIVNSSGSQTYFEMNVGGNSITSLSSTNVTVTNALRLNGIVVTGSNIFHLTNSAADATSFPVVVGHVNGTLRRTIAANTNVYSFPVGVGSTITTDRRQLEFINNNIAGVSYLDCSVSNTFKGSGSNIDALLDPIKAKHGTQIFTNVNSAAEWKLTPNATPSSGNYGVRLYLQNFSGLTDNNFTVLKRPDNSTTFFDYSAFYSSTAIPAQNGAGRIYSGGAGYAQKTGFTTFSKFAVASAATPLPVEMINFSANCDTDGIRVLWSTASEQNSQKFVIERSRDLVSWSTVAEKAAAGTSNFEIDYETLDAHPFGGVSYYRIVQYDNNGYFEIYGPISVSCGAQEDEMIIFPNPNEGDFTVEITSAEKLFDQEIQIIDLAGKIVERRLIQVQEGVNQVMFSHQDLQSGTYLIRLTGNQFKPVKVVIN